MSVVLIPSKWQDSIWMLETVRQIACCNRDNGHGHGYGHCHGHGYLVFLNTIPMNMNYL